MDNKLIAFSLIFMFVGGIIGYAVGFGYGVNATIDYGIKVGMRLLELKKINIDIDEDMIRTGIFQYKNNIGGCLFLDNNLNASLHNNTRD